MRKKLTALMMSVCVASGLFYTGGFNVRAAEEITYEEDGANCVFERVKGSTSKETLKSYEGKVENLLIPSVDSDKGRDVVAISADAFKNSVYTRNIKIPEGITSVENGMLNANYTINNIDVDENNNSYSSDDGILYNKSKTELVKCPNTRTYVKIPETVETIDEYAFSDNSNGNSEVNTGGSPITSDDIKGTALTSVSVPKSVKNIKEGAFYGCYDLTEIYYEGSEAEWNKVTKDSTNNEAIDAVLSPQITVHYEEYEPKPTGTPEPDTQSTADPGTASTANPGTGSNNTAAPSTGPAVTVTPSTGPSITVAPTPGTAIQYSPVPGYNTPVNNPTAVPTATVTPVPTDSVALPGKNYTQCIGSRLIYTAKVNSKGKLVATVKKPRSKNIKSTVIPETITIKGYEYKVTGIAKNAFADCKKLKKVVIGKNVTSIGANAFKNCSKLKTVAVISKKITSIGKNSFKSINSKASMLLPKKSYKAYKKLLKKAALPGKVKYKKIVVL